LAVRGDNSADTVSATLRTMRLQDAELQVMSDDGMALSMHQPWASLLVAGIKRFDSSSRHFTHKSQGITVLLITFRRLH